MRGHRFALALSTALVALLTVFAALGAGSALAAGRTWIRALQPPLVGFAQPNGLAASADGEHLFVGNEGSGEIDVYNTGGSFETEFKAAPSTAHAKMRGLAVDSAASSPSKGDLYVTSYEEEENSKHEEVLKENKVSVYSYNETEKKAEKVREITEDLSGPCAVAVNSSGDVFVANCAEGESEKGFVNVYGPEGTLIKEKLIKSVTQPEAIAVSSTGTVYLATHGGLYSYAYEENTRKEKEAKCLNVTTVNKVETCEPFAFANTKVSGVVIGPEAEGNVYAAPEGFGEVEELKAEKTAGETPVGVEKFDNEHKVGSGVRGIAVVGTDVFAADAGGQFDPSGEVSEFTTAARKEFTLKIKVTGEGGSVIGYSSKGQILDCEKTNGTCEAQVRETAEITLERRYGGKFSKWSGASCVEGSQTGEECRFEMPKAALEVRAEFAGAVEEFPLEVKETGTGTGAVKCKAGSGGSFAACAAKYPSGTELTVEAKANPGSELAGISGTGSALACTASPCMFTVTEASAVTATFNLIPPTKDTLGITKSGTGSGMVECAVDGGGFEGCASEYNEGTELVLRGAAGSGSTFAGWSSGSGSASCTGTGNCSFTITSDSTITATFNLIPPTKDTLGISKSGTGSGMVECAVDGGGFEGCASEYNEGTELVLRGAAGSGSTFAGWSSGSGSASCTGTGNCSFTITSDSTITATFNLQAPPPPTVTYKTCALAAKETVEWKETGPAPKYTVKEKQKTVYTGKYENKECTVEVKTDNYRDKGSTPGPEGKYELEPFAGPAHFAGKDGKQVKVGETSEGKPIYKTEDTTTVLSVYGGSDEPVQTITCGKLATTGAIVSDTEVAETIALGKCYTKEESVTTGVYPHEKTKTYKVPCTSAGETTSGTIATSALTGTLTEAEGKLYESLTGATPFATFTCQASREGAPATTVKLGGSALGEIESVAGKLGPEDAGARGEVLSFAATEHNLTAEIDGSGGYTAGLESTETQKTVFLTPEEKEEHKGQLVYIET